MGKTWMQETSQSSLSPQGKHPIQKAPVALPAAQKEAFHGLSSPAFKEGKENGGNKKIKKKLKSLPSQENAINKARMQYGEAGESVVSLVLVCFLGVGLLMLFGFLQQPPRYIISYIIQVNQFPVYIYMHSSSSHQ